MHFSKWKFQYIFIALILSVVNAKNEEYQKGHSATPVNMLKLLELETELIENLSNYADALEEKLEILRRVLPQMQCEAEKAKNGSEKYLSNPLNAFSLIRRMQQDWIDWKVYLKSPIGATQVAFMKQHQAQLPSKSDLDKSSLTIFRIQNVYGLKAKDMAKGRLLGKECNTSLNALDTYELGQYLHKHKNYALAKDWFVETGNLLIENTLLLTPTGSHRAKMLSLFTGAFVQLKYYSIALAILNSALELDYNSKDQKLLNLKAEIEKLGQEELTVIPETENKSRSEFFSHSKLHCQYKFSPSLFLRLAPLKMELVSLDPLMIIYYDLFSSHETDLQTHPFPPFERNYKQSSSGKPLERCFRKMYEEIYILSL